MEDVESAATLPYDSKAYKTLIYPIVPQRLEVRKMLLCLHPVTYSLGGQTNPTKSNCFTTLLLSWTKPAMLWPWNYSPISWDKAEPLLLVMWPWVIQPPFLYLLSLPHRLERETPLFIMENWNPYTSWISLSSCLNTWCLDHLPLISSSFFLDISFVSLFSFTSFDPTGSSFQFLSYSWSYASEIICSWKHIHTEVLIPERQFYCYHRDISVSYLVREMNHGSWIFISFYIWLFHF